MQKRISTPLFVETFSLAFIAVVAVVLAAFISGRDAFSVIIRASLILISIIALLSIYFGLKRYRRMAGYLEALIKPYAQSIHKLTETRWIIMLREGNMVLDLNLKRGGKNYFLLDLNFYVPRISYSPMNIYAYIEAGQLKMLLESGEKVKKVANKVASLAGALAKSLKAPVLVNTQSGVLNVLGRQFRYQAKISELDVPINGVKTALSYGIRIAKELSFAQFERKN